MTKEELRKAVENRLDEWWGEIVKPMDIRGFFEAARTRVIENWIYEQGLTLDEAEAKMRLAEVDLVMDGRRDLMDMLYEMDKGHPVYKFQYEYFGA
jgi:hypothetical protein